MLKIFITSWVGKPPEFHFTFDDRAFGCKEVSIDFVSKKDPVATMALIDDKSIIQGTIGQFTANQGSTAMDDVTIEFEMNLEEDELEVLKKFMKNPRRTKSKESL